jgi:uncharacterized protein YjiS (DUF1127 family)
MEMIMSTVSSTTTDRGNACGLLQTLANTFKRCCVVYITWRIEKIATAQLRAMSDRELEDIGLTRSDIVRAVTGPRTRQLSLKNPRPETTLLPS